jgi:hypothetical protein
MCNAIRERFPDLDDIPTNVNTLVSQHTGIPLKKQKPTWMKEQKPTWMMTMTMMTMSSLCQTVCWLTTFCPTRTTQSTAWAVGQSER